ncbi:ROK family protein [Halovenus salina]|uniref:ROK family protein n=1 Tax=Halovenus salina TaxID=1510225 RepID=UPI002260D6CB|nr:ROK family protein [Halovenus salina]
MSYLGLDIGGTTLAAAVATDGVEPVATATVPTPQGTEKQTATERLRGLVEQVCEAAGLKPTAITAAGVGSVGPLDQKQGAVTSPANVSDETVPVVEVLRDLLGTDAVVLHNDATCGAIAERRAASAENLVYLTLSTGIGAGIVADDKVVLGEDGNAGEVGHLTVDPAGTLPCGCGGEGHWEAYCGGANLPRYARHLHETESVETRLSLGGSTFTAGDIFAAASEDDLAALVLERVGYWNTVGVAALVQTVAPACVAVGGAIARNNPDAVLEPVRERLPEQTFLDAPEIRLATCEEPVLTGALVAARRLVE